MVWSFRARCTRPAVILVLLCPLILQVGPGPLKSPKTRKGDKNCFRPIIDDDHLFPHPTPSAPKKWRRYIICQNYDWNQSDVPVSRGSGAKICFPRWERSPLKCTPTLVFKIAIFAVKTPSCLAFPSRSYVKKMLLLLFSIFFCQQSF